MEKLILIIIGLLCVWYIYKKIFKSGGCGCGGNCESCAGKTYEKFNSEKGE